MAHAMTFNRILKQYKKVFRRAKAPPFFKNKIHTKRKQNLSLRFLMCSHGLFLN